MEFKEKLEMKKQANKEINKHCVSLSMQKEELKQQNEEMKQQREEWE